MDNNPGVAVAVPCLVLSSDGLSLAVHGDGAQDVPPASLNARIGPNTPLTVLNPETGEVTPASLSALAGDATALGGVVGARIDDADKGAKMAFVRTDTGEITPIIIGAGLGPARELRMAGAMDGAPEPWPVVACRKGAESATFVEGDDTAALSPISGGRRDSDESEKLASYDETLKLLMQPEGGDGNGGSRNARRTCRHAGEGTGDVGCARFGKGWGGGAVESPGDGKPGIRYVVDNRTSGPGGQCPRVCAPVVERQGGKFQMDRSSVGAQQGCMGRQGAPYSPGSDRFSRVGARNASLLNGEREEVRYVSVLSLDSDQKERAEGTDGGFGVPCYVALQRLLKQQQQPQPQQQLQQQQQQQEQAVGLWLQAYLSGLYSGYGLASVPGSGGPPSMMSSLSCMSVPSRWVVNAGDPQKQVQDIQDNEDETTDNFDRGRKRSLEDTQVDETKARVAKIGRKRVEDRVCSNCATRATPFWRKDKHTGKPLCNACGLYFSKNDIARPLSLWRNAGGPGDSSGCR